MHLLLTDRLTCSRCGPAFGLVLLADGVEERRVLEGALGCPNCRERYPVQAGFGDLRPPPRSPLPEAAAGGVGSDPDPPAVEALAAALGLGQGAGTTLLVGDAVRFARPLAELLPEMEVAAVDPRTRAWGEAPGVSRMAAGAALPFFGGMIRGVGLSAGGLDAGLAAEAARVLAPLHRVVVTDVSTSETVASILQAAGLPRILEGAGLVAAGA